MPSPLSRRRFLKAAAGAGLTLLGPGLARTYAAADTVNLGIVGAGGMGKGNRRWLKRIGGTRIVALCDVDTKRLARAASEHPDAKTWTDYRKMLTDMRRDIDAVCVSTPDHHHFPASMLAMQLGMGVDTEKPLAHSVWEARQMGIAAARHGVATQMDNEGHAREGLRKAVEWVKSGAIGPVREVHIFTNRPIWPQGIPKRPPAQDPPEHLEWDLWIGPAPFRKYHKHLHPFAWRGWWDFGTGALGDMGCHFWDSPFWALTLGHPETVEAEQGGNSAETGPLWSTVRYEFPARGPNLPPVTVTWWDGRKPRTLPNGEVTSDVPNLPPRPPCLEEDREFPRNGTMFVGEKETLLVQDTASPRIIPEARMQAFEPPEPFLPSSPGHKKEWLAAVRGGEEAGSNFHDYGGPLAEVVLLGNVAIRTGEKIRWDGRNLKAKGCPEADRYLRRPYREGWDFSPKA